MVGDVALIISLGLIFSQTNVISTSGYLSPLRRKSAKKKFFFQQTYSGPLMAKSNKKALGDLTG
jgi:hypothetical protein